MPIAGQNSNETSNDIINIDEIDRGRGLVDLKRQIMGNVIAEGRNHGIVVRAAPLPESVIEPKHVHGVIVLFLEGKELILGHLLGLAIRIV